MNIKKILLILLLILGLSGCVNLKNLDYDDIVNGISSKPKNANTFKSGYQFYVPRGLHVESSGTNYTILSGNDVNYYLYVDLVSYNESKDFVFEHSTNSLYSKYIKFEDKKGYVEINLWENNQYLIEIMYNYAKIEVMVEESLTNKALANAVNILNSVKYNDLIIENLLADDNLTYTEEIFDLFEEAKDNSNILDYENSNEEVDDEEIVDTDFIN